MQLAVSATVIGLVVLLGSVHLACYYAGRRALAGALKALPILLLAWLVSRHAGGVDPSAGRWVALGLVLSAAGDVSLVLAGGFLAGLSAFFAAHVCYIAAFAPGAMLNGVTMAIGAAIGLGVMGMLAYLWPHVARVRVPVVVYVVALATMGWCAVARAIGGGGGVAEVAGAVGGLAFLVSDSVLAVDRFAHPFPGAHAVVMVTYYGAQLLIARAMF